MRSTKENAPPNLATTLPTPQQTWLRSMELASAKADAKEEAEHAAAQLPAACAMRPRPFLRRRWRQVADGDVVLLCAGPLGRLLAVRWFAAQPRATYLELGSFWDPELQPGGATLGPRYYSQTQCGVTLDRAAYTPHSWYRGCEAKGDTHADIDEGAIWAKLAPRRGARAQCSS